MSRPVSSRQTGVHPDLARLLARRRACAYRKPIHPASAAAFASADQFYRECNQPVVLDAGCGTGASSYLLAEQHPDAIIVAVDKSAHRLARRRGKQHQRVMHIRADLIDFWRLAAASGWQLQHHYLLYPSPWPKPEHLARRWHGHPVLPWLLALGGMLELRCNWQVYAEEFAAALTLLLQRPISAIRLDDPGEPLSPFERKYAASGHVLYCCQAQIRAGERTRWLQETNQLVPGNQPQP
ncbi:MAG: methyltransferase domain-containing protein [Gammaproteobacteria bacterium]